MKYNADLKGSLIRGQDILRFPISGNLVLMETTEERLPYPIEAVTDLAAHYSDEHFKYVIKQIRDVLRRVIAEDNSSDQQKARVKILRYLDVQLDCAARWSTDTADLMALVLRRLIELRFYTRHVSVGEAEAGRFLAKADTDSVEMYKLIQGVSRGNADRGNAGGSKAAAN